MMPSYLLADTKPIDHDSLIDLKIKDSLQVGNGNSFITFAGAGSGKTFSLKEALNSVKEKYHSEFSQLGKQVAVITFTNNAAEEIQDRVERHPIFHISTIHSFCWHAIRAFNDDIRQWFLKTIPDVLTDLRDREMRGRAGVASDTRKRNIIRLTEKLEWLSTRRSFVYDPNGINSTQNALSHTEVLKIFASFLSTKPLMAQILLNKYPFIFVDESQDTNKEVINAIFDFQDKYQSEVVVGLFGDTMQRIFGGGEPELGITTPKGWLELDKEMNHRSGRRIVGLGNAIRREDDGRQQYAKEGAANGFIRFFIFPQETKDKENIEKEIRDFMSQSLQDAGWSIPNSKDTAVLLLEHRMVSKRLGFSQLLDALSKSSNIRDQLFDGTNTEVNFFSQVVAPLVSAINKSENFKVMAILRDNKSPLLEEVVFSNNLDDPLSPARTAVKKLKNVITEKTVSFGEVLSLISNQNLLKIPRKLDVFVSQRANLDDVAAETIDEPNSEDYSNDEFDAWALALETPFSQIFGYHDYVNENAIYRTHQGVKGNEFERVMVIMDDDDAGGFMFSYEQYFGAKLPSAASRARADAGEETGIERTRRLFYVTSTRAKSSLAHVIYTSSPTAVKENLIRRGFAANEEILGSNFEVME
ncbi:UvrD-helicase domain-containing protein [Microvirga sp. W0021]|uniref:DNA 3'-5' helicase II n=1 Tax=Hohaiivirga grylli TaxID=3133970 RepID=A0ABV0BHZ2_9HYPH